MKNLLLLSLFFLFLKSASAQTNIYHPFPDSNAVWNYHWEQYCFWNGGFGDDYYSIVTSGDTIINTSIYHKLNVLFVMSNNLSCNSLVTSGYKGAFREDTVLRKVFFVEAGDSAEVLLFDFNMQVGDTVRGYTQSWSPDPDIVQSLDSILVGSDYRKRWCINTCYFIYLIEGIGSTYGLISLSPGCVTDQAGYTLDCFSVNGQNLYPDTTTNCEIIDARKDIPDENFSATLFPNPFHTNSKLEVRNIKTDPGIYHIKIYDSMGVLVRSEGVLNITSYILYRNGLSDGMYFYELRTDNFEPVGNGKFVIE